MVAGSGSLDISFKLISVGDVQGTPLAEMSLDDFEQPIRIGVRTMFLTARAAARHTVTLLTGGVPEAIPADYDGRDAITEVIVGKALLKRAATFEDVGNVAAFAASDRARTITATAINITAGAEID